MRISSEVPLVEGEQVARSQIDWPRPRVTHRRGRSRARRTSQSTRSRSLDVAWRQTPRAGTPHGRPPPAMPVRPMVRPESQAGSRAPPGRTATATRADRQLGAPRQRRHAGRWLASMAASSPLVSRMITGRRIRRVAHRPVRRGRAGRSRRGEAWVLRSGGCRQPARSPLE